jgi:amino acid adenylation domain-containing protein/FkbH-like protein
MERLHETMSVDPPPANHEITHTREPNDPNHRRSTPSLPPDGIVPIVLAATFTADLIEAPLKFWIDALEIPALVTVAPYGQLFQELLSADSAVGRNQNGFNILMVRPEDWIRQRLSDVSVSSNVDHLGRVVEEFISAVRGVRTRSSAALLVLSCPTSTAVPEVYRAQLTQIEHRIVDDLNVLPNVHCFTHHELQRLYPVTEFEDPRSEQLANIPYTIEYFTAAATLFARRIAALTKPPLKVIAVDCDNTLWKGICGEDGPAGVELTAMHRILQEELVRQHDAGMLLCLCSKNNQDEVETVFRCHPEMPLRHEHFVASRVNWNAKSSNLNALALELGLALDSFLFVDDSPLECAEVRVHCPGVLTLQLPEDAGKVAHVLRHAWVLDRVGVTEEAKHRTAQYKDNRARARALEGVDDLGAFIDSLELVVELLAAEASDLARVAELTQRTNQFNLTNNRRRHSEVEALWKARELDVFTVRVRDRFGDYGLVGALLVRWGVDIGDVDTFVLSCRVLGRGVEHRIVRELARLAHERGKREILLRYRPSKRNAPAREFLERAFLPDRLVLSDHSGQVVECQFSIPVDQIQRLASTVEFGAAEAEPEGREPTANAGSPSKLKWHDTALRLSYVPDIVNEMKRSLGAVCAIRADSELPRNADERTVARIWTQLLGVSNIGVNDDFFESGGNSLLAVQAVSRIQSQLGVELSLHEFFEGATIAAVAEKLAVAAPEAAPVVWRMEKGPAPLSWAQQRLWFIDQLEPSCAYHVPLAIRLHGALNRDGLQQALDALLTRHEALRTTFVTVRGQLLQKVNSQTRFAISFADLSGGLREAQDARVTDLEREALAIPFDLSKGPLIRVNLIHLTDREHLLLIIMHHMISDGWSIGVLFRELCSLYTAFCQSMPNPLAPLPVQYSDYVRWQIQWLNDAELHSQMDYWKLQLQGAPELLTLPTDRPRPESRTYLGGTYSIVLDRKLTAQIKARARAQHVTLATLLFTAWFITLAKLSGQQDLVIGMPVANRRRTEFEDLIGFFVNVLALRVRAEGDPTVTELLEQVKSTLLRAQENQDVPFEKVVEALQPTRSLSHSPIFQVMFVLQSAPRQIAQLPGLRIVEESVPLHTAKFDLTLSLQDSEDGFVGSINYARDLFDASTVERWAGSFFSVLRAMDSDEGLKFSVLPILGEEERREVIETFNATGAYLPQGQVFSELFEAQVRRQPDMMAAEFGDRGLTFSELNRRANQLARYLRKNGVNSNQFVGIYLERNLEMLVAMLGILKAGAAYLPLDPDYPSDRISYMLEDAAPSALLLQRHLAARLPESTMSRILLDEEWDQILEEPDGNLDAASLGLRVDSLAYVIYTSGSSGCPKGVMVEHRNLVSLWHALEPLYQPAPGCQRVAVNASFSFDSSVKQVVQWASGRTIVLVPQECRWDGDAMIKFMARTRVDAIDCTPSQLRIWIASGLLREELPLRLVLVGGEAIDESLWRTLVESSQIAFVNVYGPTECTVDATAAPLMNDSARAHIGRPLANRRVYILDRFRQPVPIGIVGEIYIGGAGVARGYLHNADLTQQRFLVDPFSVDPQARMYKTGDLGRWRPNGSIEYVGRNDDQVKLRGFRIELGEIEAQLNQYAHIRQSVVIAREDSSEGIHLVAYVVAGDRGTASVENIRNYLKTKLPDYMVPSAIVELERLPLSSSGKVDRRALPPPGGDAFTRPPFEAPRGNQEEQIASIWAELLNVQPVGRKDNFFELGGHSLLATRVITRLRESFALEIPLRALFDGPTVEQLGIHIDAERTRSGSPEFVEALRREIDELKEDAVLARIAALEAQLCYPQRASSRSNPS